MKPFYVFLVLITSLFLSCKSDDDDIPNNTVQSLVFGEYHGECFGKCFNVFKIDTQKITKDNVVDHYTSDYTFKSSFDYAKEVYNEHKSLLTIIPDELKNGTDKTYGCPDCGDQGGYYFLLEMSNGGIKKYTIDTDNTADQTSEIIAFKKKIANSIRVLKIMN